jgi:hypothetical protein
MPLGLFPASGTPGCFCFGLFHAVGLPRYFWGVLKLVGHTGLQELNSVLDGFGVVPSAVGIAEGVPVFVTGRPFGFVVLAVYTDKIKARVLSRLEVAPAVVSPTEIFKVFAARYNAKIFHNNVLRGEIN